MTSYKLVVHGEAVKVLLGRSAAQRTKLIRVLDHLAEDPFQEGDIQERDETGRTQQVKLIHGHIVTFYPDHPVKQLHVTDIEIV